MIFSYHNKRKNDVLKAFGFETKDGYITERSSGNVVVDNLGAPIKSSRFGGVRKGSIEVINSDIASLIKLRKKLKSK